MSDVIDLAEWRRSRGYDSDEAELDTKEPFANRDPDGRFKSPAVVSLLELLADVARAAAERLPHICEDVTRISEEVWDQAAIPEQAKHGRIPEGRQVVSRLRQLTGLEYQWREWILIALDEDRDLVKALAARARKPPRLPSQADVAFALLAIARRAGLRRFSATQYEETLARWIVHEEQARRGGSTIRKRFPDSEQIIALFGSWEAAMIFAGLEPPSVAPRGQQRGCPVPDAMTYFFARNGWLPTRKQLERFAEDEGFSLAAVRGRPWAAWIAAAVERAAEYSELPPPPPYQSPPPDHWEPVDLHGIELPVRGRRHIPLADVREAVRAYIDWLPTTVGATGASTDRLYRRWSEGHPDRPSLNAILRYGKLRELVAMVQAEAAAPRQPRPTDASHKPPTEPLDD